MELSSPLVFDSYRRNRVTGSLIVIDEATNETVAAGVILDTDTEAQDATPARRPRRECSPNVRWQGSRLTRRMPLGVPGACGSDGLVHGAAGRRQVDDRDRRRGAPGGRRPAGVPARRRQPASRPQRRSRLRRGRALPRTCAAPRTSRGCSRSRGRSRWSASSALTAAIARRPRRCTPPMSCEFIEVFVERAAGGRASSATPRVCTRARARASCTA